MCLLHEARHSKLIFSSEQIASSCVLFPRWKSIICSLAERKHEPHMQIQSQPGQERCPALIINNRRSAKEVQSGDVCSKRNLNLIAGLSSRQCPFILLIEVDENLDYLKVISDMRAMYLLLLMASPLLATTPLLSTSCQRGET